MILWLKHEARLGFRSGATNVAPAGTRSLARIK